MNGWLIEAILHLLRHLRTVEQKVDLLSQHLGVTLPTSLVQAGKDLDVKTKALQAALNDAQAQQQPTKKEP